MRDQISGMHVTKRAERILKIAFLSEQACTSCLLATLTEENDPSVSRKREQFLIFSCAFVDRFAVVADQSATIDEITRSTTNLRHFKHSECTWKHKSLFDGSAKLLQRSSS